MSNAMNPGLHGPDTSPPRARVPSGSARDASSRPVSIVDVARLAGVSPGTVSRAISRPEMISQRTRDRVLRAADELGYVANVAARALVMRQSRTVGAIVPRTGMANYGQLVNALEAELARLGYTLLLAAPRQQDARESAVLQTLLEHRVDAVAILGANPPAEILATLEKHRKPFVLMWGHQSRHGDCIGYDEATAADVLIAHLHELGHRQVGLISGYTARRERSARRKQCILEALARHGMTLSERANTETEHGFREGFDAARAWLAEPARLTDVTAIVCSADYLAAGALSAFNQAGLQIPRDLSLASFNDNDFSAYLHPPLTTVRLPIREIGTQAARYLAERLAGQAPAAPSPLPVSLIVRSSTGKPRTAATVGQGRTGNPARA